MAVVDFGSDVRQHETRIAGCDAPTLAWRVWLMRGVAEAGLTFAVGLFAAPFVLWVLHRVSLLDIPNARSSHEAATPRAGGLAPALACTLAGSVSTSLAGASRGAVLFVAVCMGLIGFVDDVRQLGAFLRLAGQLLVASVSLLWLARGLGGESSWHLLFCAGVTLWVVGYVNAFNFMDGINGISVAQAGVAGAVWWGIGVGRDIPPLAVAGAVSVAAALSFAPFNVPRAAMFLGDVGSYFLGGWLAATAVIAIRAGLPIEAVLAPLALYGADTLITLVRRVRRREAWYHPHRDHTYQRLVKGGWSHVRTSSVIAAVMVTTSALGALSLTESFALRVAGDVLALSALGIYLAMPSLVAGGRSSGSSAALGA